MELSAGIYELIIDSLLEEKLKGRSGVTTGAVDPADGPAALSEYLAERIRQTLAGFRGINALEHQVKLCNRLMETLNNASCLPYPIFPTLTPLQELQSISTHEDMIKTKPIRPDTPLALACLFTGTRLDFSLVSQLKKEMQSADRIDILCSFIKWSGIRVLQEELKRFVKREGTQLRVITTSYMGATDIKAVDFISDLVESSFDNKTETRKAQLRVSYDTHRTRLHAKAYLFHRKSNFGSAYIGSSNISQAALTDGLEWNVKVSQYQLPHLWEKITATFETYWNDSEFELYTPDRRRYLMRSLQKEQAGDSGSPSMYFFDLRPYGYQQEILDQLKKDREVHERKRHLVVAATGTGKTMIAAFDYREWSREYLSKNGKLPRMLYIAHRQEILKRSMDSFRQVLRDANFGELFVGNNTPGSMDHLFVSVQMANSRELWQLGENFYEYIVMDEFHHAAADTYLNLINSFRPQSLLGLTATPERMDGLDILSFFDGHLSAEIRLPDAINRKLLCPFQYFGVSDNADLSGVRWLRGKYDQAELSRALIVTHRAILVIDKVRQILLDPLKAKGLGFCVSVEHARFMAEQFNLADIPSDVLTAESCQNDRDLIQCRLQRGEINFIFVVDLYNEGIDIPELDTVLFLRPTESLTIFLQQLGRGLRLSDGKDCLTVLDFIGNANPNYRYDVRYRALLDDPARDIEKQVREGFPHLPAGCTIELERVAQERVLNNISTAIGHVTVRGLIGSLRRFSKETGKSLSLANFLQYHQMSLDDIYRKHKSWSRLKAEAGLIPNITDPDEVTLTKGLRRMDHINGAAQIRFLLSILQDPEHRQLQMCSENERRLLLMLHFSLWGRASGEVDLVGSLKKLWQNPIHMSELKELLDYNFEQNELVSKKPDLSFETPLELHGKYSRDEALTALGYWNERSQPEMREGVVHIKDIRSDAFLFTLDKSEKDYSPTTMYQDYAISDTLFHWQSQSVTSEESETGQRYIHHKEREQNILLFVREKKVQRGCPMPYYYLGPAEYVSHEGSRPISIIWKLHNPIPARLMRKTARLAVD